MTLATVHNSRLVDGTKLDNLPADTNQILSDMQGAGWTSETIKENADTIATKANDADVLKKDGSVQLNGGYVPVNPQDIPTKQYTDDEIDLKVVEISSSDMAKAIYDTNDDGIVNAADEVDGIDLATNDQYYGKNSIGTKGFHTLNKTTIGLGNIDNTSDADKPVSTAQQTALNLKQDIATLDAAIDANANVAANTTHRGLTSNPHGVTAAQVGAVAVIDKATQIEAEAGTDDTKWMTPLKTEQAIVDNIVIASQAEAEAGTDNTKYMTPLRTKEAINVFKGDEFISSDLAVPTSSTSTPPADATKAVINYIYRSSLEEGQFIIYKTGLTSARSISPFGTPSTVGLECNWGATTISVSGINTSGQVDIFYFK